MTQLIKVSRDKLHISQMRARAPPLYAELSVKLEREIDAFPFKV